MKDNKFTGLAGSLKQILWASALLAAVPAVASESIQKFESDWQGVEIQQNFQPNTDFVKPGLKPRKALKAFGAPRQQAQSATSLDHEFWVYDASVVLYDDDDGDGFYQKFSLDFDVDVSEGYADIYAEVYIRAPGDDWLLLHTTDVFEIYEDDASDGIEVMTSLVNGYVPDYYDILIDIWEYGEFEDYLVATYDNVDDPDLDNLPLEDREEDRYYYEEHDHVHVSAGSSGSWLILLMLGLAIIRWGTQQNRQHKSELSTILSPTNRN